MFGLGWIGDRATIKQMPLMNMLVLCRGEAPVVVSVCDCTDHMIDRKKKDAKYRGKIFNVRWKSGTHHTVTQIVFSLMEQLTSKKLEKFCV